LLLMTTGRRTGKLHTTPVFYIADAERLVLCSVTPPLERASPWTLNLRAQPLARVQVGGTVGTYFARDATSEEVDRYWPRLIGMWPTYEEHYARSRRRVLFVLEPTPNARRVHPGYHSVTPHIAVSDPAETCRVPPDGAPGVSVRLRG
jgi:deazaflavin-dependent oxidoreductase (nitroreductase family)